MRLRLSRLLAREYGNGPVGLRRISVETGAPAEFLHLILLEIKNCGLLESRRGPQGGYRLLVPPDRVTIGSIVRMIDGPFMASPCMGELEANRCKDCKDPDQCQTRLVMRDLNEAIAAVLNRTTLASSAKPL